MEQGPLPTVRMGEPTRVASQRVEPLGSGRDLENHTFVTSVYCSVRWHPMGYTEQLLDDVRAQLAPDDAVLKEAKERRELVRSAAESFRGTYGSFVSGSLAHGTANCPIHQRDKGLDADCGIKLDRRSHPTLGPDSEEQDEPTPIVDEVREHLRPRIRATYPKATLEITKRAILVRFGAPLPAGEDPTVDLIVGLERRNQPGLWIPNTEAKRWDPSHPEKHTALLTAEPKTLRVVRARAIRLAKAENRRMGKPPLCSFNLSALALMFVEPGMDVSHALLALWADGATDLKRRLTPDPAHVSPPIKVEDRDKAVTRLVHAASCLEEALENDDDEHHVRRVLAELWPDFISRDRRETTKARAAAHLKSGSALSVTAAGLLSTSAGQPHKSVRSFGGLRQHE